MVMLFDYNTNQAHNAKNLPCAAAIASLTIFPVSLPVNTPRRIMKPAVSTNPPTKQANRPATLFVK